MSLVDERVEERWQQVKSIDYSSVIRFQQGRAGVFVLSKGERASPLLVGLEGEGFGLMIFRLFKTNLRDFIFVNVCKLHNSNLQS